MQELRAIALDDDGNHVICEGKAGRFRVPLDDTMRSAIAGELPRGVTTELEPGAELSPREIQARIRAGATAEEVANLVGAPLHRIKRFAGPVLLERARAAELAQRAHPVRGDGPMHTALRDVVTGALVERGHAESTDWDAWKNPEGRWIVQIAWTVGKSRNEAHFTFVPGAHGGTATPTDQTAREMLDPDARRALRSIEAEPAAPEGLRAVAPTPRAAAPAAAAGPVPTPRQAPDSHRDTAHRRPEMPSWEDVLLGVRGTSNG